MILWMQSLSEPIRTRLLRILEKSELTVAEMCTTLQLPQSTVSRHLKVLSDDGWISSRRDGASNLYRMHPHDIDHAQKRLWNVVKNQSVSSVTADQDDARLEQVLDSRRSKSQAFFSSAAGKWDRIRTELFGHRVDSWALAAAIDSESIVGDLGCGTGVIAQSIAPWVEHVIAVDSSTAMLHTAKKRLKDAPNVELRRGELTQIPIEDGVLSIAILILVLPYLSAPQVAFSEAYRVCRPGGRLVIVDMVEHDRKEFREELGHSWLGFSNTQITGWLKHAGWNREQLVCLPPESEAKGPGLFVARAHKT